MVRNGGGGGRESGLTVGITGFIWWCGLINVVGGSFRGMRVGTGVSDRP